jgi:hypothetical protein
VIPVCCYLNNLVINNEKMPDRLSLYQASFSVSKGWSPWIDYLNIHEDSMFYIQGILGDGK